MPIYTPPPNSIFDGPVTNLLSILCTLIEILSRAQTKGAKKRSLNGFKFATSIGLFPHDGAASMAVKGLNYRTEDLKRNHTADHNTIAACGMIKVFELN